MRKNILDFVALFNELLSFIRALEALKNFIELDFSLILGFLEVYVWNSNLLLFALLHDLNFVFLYSYFFLSLFF